MLTAEVAGKEVIDSQGHELGKITDTQFDEKEWRVLGFEVQLDKEVAEEYHLRHRLRKTRVLVSIDHIQAVGDKVILKGSKADLLELIASSPKMESQGTKK